MKIKSVLLLLIVSVTLTGCAGGKLSDTGSSETGISESVISSADTEDSGMASATDEREVLDNVVKYFDFSKYDKKTTIRLFLSCMDGTEPFDLTGDNLEELLAKYQYTKNIQDNKLEISTIPSVEFMKNLTDCVLEPGASTQTLIWSYGNADDLLAPSVAIRTFNFDTEARTAAYCFDHDWYAVQLYTVKSSNLKERLLYILGEDYSELTSQPDEINHYHWNNESRMQMYDVIFKHLGRPSTIYYHSNKIEDADSGRVYQLEDFDRNDPNYDIYCIYDMGRYSYIFYISEEKGNTGVSYSVGSPTIVPAEVLKEENIDKFHNIVYRRRNCIVIKP